MAHADPSHAHDDHGHDGHGHDAVHHYDYVKIWGLLVVLLVVSVVGPMAEILWLTLITAFGIAFVKAYMVARYFMHVNVQQPIVHYFLVTALVFMVLFFAGTAPDVMNHEGTRWVNDAAIAEAARVEAAHAAGTLDHHEAPADGGHGEAAGGHH